MHMIRKPVLCCLLLLAVFWAPAFLAPAQAENLPAVGQTLPTLSLKAPAFGQDAVDLGVAGKKTFRLQDLRAKVIVLEVIGV